MKRNIWILNHYATAMYENKGGRHYFFADNLRKEGYTPAIFCSNQFHDRDECINLDGKRYKTEKDDEFPFIFVKSFPYKNNGFSRILNMVSFYKNIFHAVKEFGKLYGKPDIVLASSVHPLTLIAGIKIARKFKVLCICEIRDLWPESIFTYSSLKKSSIIGRLLQSGEKWIYKKADKIIFLQQGGYDYIVEQNWQNEVPKEKCYYINNGVDLKKFDYDKEFYPLEDEDLQDDGKYKVIYTGSVRRVNNLKVIVDTAKEMQENDKIKFLIWGDGDERFELAEYVGRENLTNVKFKGSVNKKYIPYILTKADLNLSHHKYTDILRFGMSQNKEFEYLASGRPVLCTTYSNYDIIESSNSGRCVREQTVESIKTAVLDSYKISAENSELYEKIGQNARKTAEEYDFKVLTAKLIDVIEGAK